MVLSSSKIICRTKIWSLVCFAWCEATEFHRFFSRKWKNFESAQNEKKIMVFHIFGCCCCCCLSFRLLVANAHDLYLCEMFIFLSHSLARALGASFSVGRSQCLCLTLFSHSRFWMCRSQPLERLNLTVRSCCRCVYVQDKFFFSPLLLCVSTSWFRLSSFFSLQLHL